MSKCDSSKNFLYVVNNYAKIIYVNRYKFDGQQTATKPLNIKLNKKILKFF